MTESETPSPYDERVELPDAERVERALKTLREFARRTADSAVTDTRSDRSARWRDTPLHNTVDGLLDGLGLERDDVDDGDQDLVDALRDWFEEGDHRVRGPKRRVTRRQNELIDSSNDGVPALVGSGDTLREGD